MDNPKANLEESDEALSLHMAQDVCLEISQNGNTDVDLVIHSQQKTHTDVMADLYPIKVVPETLR